MSTLIFLLSFLLVIALGFIWYPFVKKQHSSSFEITRREENTQLYKDRLAQLNAEKEQNQISQNEFNELKLELDVAFSQDLTTDDSAATKSNKKALTTPILLSCVIIIISCYGYLNLGNYFAVLAPSPKELHSGLSREALIAKQMQIYEQAVKATPNNASSWYNLAHTYMSASLYGKAIHAFDEVIRIEGEHADLLGPKANAMYYLAGDKITSEIQLIIDKALQLDPYNLSALMLVAMDAYFAEDYAKAIQSWQTILKSPKQDFDRATIENAIATAQAKAGIAPSASDSQDGTAGLVKLEITLSPTLQNRLSPNDTVFVFARIPGTRMPLVAKRLTGKDIPSKVILSSSDAMGMGNDLSNIKEVEVMVTVSKNGGVKAQKGDLQGKLASVEVGNPNFHKLIIDTEI